MPLQQICIPLANMRILPCKDAEIVSQAYFSESVKLVDQDGDWVKIETAVDQYQGWTLANALVMQESHQPSSSNKFAHIDRCAAHIYAVPETIFGPLMTLPFESRLELIEAEENSRWLKVLLIDQREAYVQRGDIILDAQRIKEDAVCSFSKRFLGLPYTWGGRTSFGYDCSGFVQMLYRQMGIYLPRDAKDQVRWQGFKCVPLEAIMPGNLIFFGSREDQIRHVGMYLGNDLFIHATVSENAPYIHTSQLSHPEWSGLGKWPYRTVCALTPEGAREKPPLPAAHL